MAINQLPFDVAYSFDKQLREVPANAQSMRQAVSWLLERLAQANDDPRKRVRLAGLAGVYARIVHDFETAEQVLRQALALAETLGDQRLLLVNQLRLAHVYQWQGRYALSNPLFDELLARCQGDATLADYLDFAYWHAGKNAFDQGRFRLAVHYFQAALQQRQKKAARP